MILIWQFGDRIKITKLTYGIIDLCILQAWVSLHTVLKTANFKILLTVFFKQTTKYNVRQ